MVVKGTVVWIDDSKILCPLAMDSMSLEDLLDAVARSLYPPSLVVSVAFGTCIDIQGTWEMS